jgi:hypothetical protein
MPVGEDGEMVRCRVLVAEEQALRDEQVVEAPSLPHDRVIAADRPGVGVRVDRTAQDAKPLDRRVAGLDLKAVRNAPNGSGRPSHVFESGIVEMTTGMRAVVQVGSSGRISARMVSRASFVYGRPGLNSAVLSRAWSPSAMTTVVEPEPFPSVTHLAASGMVFSGFSFVPGLLSSPVSALT